MAEPIVRSFVIDTTQAEQNLQRLDVVTTATNASLDGLYNQLIALDAQLQKLDPNSQAFAEVNTQIQQLETTITGIETGKIDDIGKAIESIDAGNAAQSIQQVGDAVQQVVTPVNDLANATDQLNAELKEIPKEVVPDEIVPPDLIPTPVIENAKSLKQQLKELQVQLAATDPDSAKYRELAAAAGELKDKIQDAAQAVGTQAGGAFERVGGSLELVTGRIQNLDFAGAAEGAKLLAKNITDIKPGDITKGIQGIGSALGSVGKALLTNPIFLIGAAIAGAIVYAEELLSLIDGVTDAETEALNVQKESAAVAKQNYDNISATEETLKRQGMTEKEITALKLEALNTAILEQQAVVETTQIQAEAQIKAAERNAEYLKTFLDFVTFPQRKLAEFFEGFVNGSIDILNKLGLGIEKIDVSSVFEDVNNFVVKKIFDPEQERKDQKKIVDDAKKSLTSLNNQREGLLNAQAAKDKAARDKAVADDKAALDKQYAAEKNYYDKVAALQDEAYEKTLTKEEQEELAIIQKYEALFAAANEAKIDTVDLQRQLNAELAALDAQRTADATAEAEKRKQLERDAVNKDFLDSYQSLQNEFIAAEDARYFNSLNNTEQEELRITQKYENLFAKADAAGKDTTKLQQELAAKLKDIQDRAANNTAASFAEAFQKGLAFADQGLNALNSLTDVVFANKLAKVKKGSKEEEALAKKQFKAQKALQLGAATIDAAKAITASLASAPVAIGPIPNPAGIASLTLATVTGAANIAKIAATKFEGGGGGGVDTPTPSIGGGGGQSQPAQFNPLASSFLQDRPEQLTPRAYVLSGDVASQQEVRTKVEDLARIG